MPFLHPEEETGSILDLGGTKDGKWSNTVDLSMAGDFPMPGSPMVIV